MLDIAASPGVKASLESLLTGNGLTASRRFSPPACLHLKSHVLTARAFRAGCQESRRRSRCRFATALHLERGDDFVAVSALAQGAGPLWSIVNL
jgi:hypothetical protein